MKKIVLASSSPRRRRILECACVPFELDAGEVDESVDEELSPYDMVKILSDRKAKAAAERVAEPAVIIGADTVVAIQGRILYKPENGDEAFRMLKRLQGRQHSVYTGVTLINMDEGGVLDKVSIVDTTTVTIKPLTDSEISMYIQTGEPYGKAGAYAVQGIGSLLVERIEGDYNTVVGLPLVKISEALKGWGMDLSENWGLAKVE
jgi:septum formation protein